MPEFQSPAPRALEHGSATRLRISKVLERHKIDYGSYSKLEQAIRDAIRDHLGSQPDREGAPRFVDRRKLKSIVDNDPRLVLSIGELRALDLYLEGFGHGLAYNPLFEKQEVLYHLAKSGRVDFLLGAKAEPNDPLRINISHWDVLGLNQIQTGVLGFSQNVKVEIREMLMHDGVEEARASLADESVEALFGDRGPSLVCLGSSRGNHLAERMLCHMAGLKPFQDEQPDGTPDPPFHFVWDRLRPWVLPSPFHLYGEEVNRRRPSVGEAVLQRKAACFLHGDSEYLVDDLTREDRRQGSTYALCAAQRRESGQIWLLVAGLTGPATYAAAHWVHRMPAALDDHKPGRPSRVFWYLLRAEAVMAKEGQREAYRVGEAEVVASGQDWG